MATRTKKHAFPSITKNERRLAKASAMDAADMVTQLAVSMLQAHRGHTFEAFAKPDEVMGIECETCNGVRFSLRLETHRSDEFTPTQKAAAKGGAARAARMTPAERSASSSAAAKARWAAREKASAEAAP